MKKLLLAICALITVYSFSQTKFESYKSDYFSKDYDISIAQEKNGSVTYYVECSSMDSTSKQTVLLVQEKESEDFKAFILSLKETYSKWTKTALENKVVELSKEVEYKTLTYQSAFSYGGWHFDFHTSLSGRYRIVDGKYLMVIRSSKLQSSSNQFIKSDGFAIVFNSEKEFDDFLSKFNFEKAHKFFDDKKSKEDLFKN